MTLLDKIGRRLASSLFAIAGGAIVAMMLLTTADVVLRFFRHPIPGTYELVSFFGAIAVAFAMAHTSVEKGHIAVSVIVDRLPARLQHLTATVTGIAGTGFFALLAWQMVLYGTSLRASGEVSLTLQLPFYPFIYGIGLSAAAVAFILATETLSHAQRIFHS
ncbi:MAG: C4-dicarboxylate ABC transporter permease [Desulfuromonas sp.]|uniref:TRAP transporter small permease n=1 Tax=Desulfuromonas sp. TaxID=892 RepID=UPI000CB0A93E|nr:TRAP transporter small permease [Desulfuromonas sp.]PLX82660.1 MAG: C4-dicarboxylate ABC transporter permease [Desulfuromonas sp.]